MTSKTSFMKYFLIAFTLMFISSGLNAGTFGSDGKKKDKEKKEELSADGPYVLYQPDGKTRVISVDKKGKITDTTYVALPEDFTLHVVDHKGRFPFETPRLAISATGESVCYVRSARQVGLCY